MKKLLNKFYLNGVVLMLAFVGATTAWLSWSIVSFSENQLKLGIFALLFVAITITFFVSYYKGETNIQKVMFGSLFIFLIVDMIEVLFDYIEDVDNYGIVYIVMSSLIILDLVILFLSHILQQSDHVGKSITQVVAQCGGLLMVLMIAFMIIMIVNGSIDASKITFILSFIFTSFMLICVETRIGEYKQVRAELTSKNAWTEEARKETKKIFKL